MHVLSQTARLGRDLGERPLRVSLTSAARRKIFAELERARDDLVWELETGGLLVANSGDRPELPWGITVVDCLNDIVAESWAWGLQIDTERFAAHVAALRERPGLDQVCGGWHTHPGPEEDAHRLSEKDIKCVLAMQRDIAKVSVLQRSREWVVELIVTPGRPLTDPLYQWGRPEFHPWLVAPPLVEGEAPRVVLADWGTPLRVSEPLEEELLADEDGTKDL